MGHIFNQAKDGNLRLRIVVITNVRLTFITNCKAASFYADMSVWRV